MGEGGVVGLSEDVVLELHLKQWVELAKLVRRSWRRHGTMKFQGLYINIYCCLTNHPQT